MGTSLGKKDRGDDLRDFVTTQDHVRARGAADQENAPAPARTPAAASPQDRQQPPRSGKDENKWARRSYNFRPDLADRLFMLQNRWLFADPSMERMNLYKKVMSENMFVTCLLSYALDQLEEELENDTEGGLADQLPQYLPVTQRNPE